MYVVREMVDVGFGNGLAFRVLVSLIVEDGGKGWRLACLILGGEIGFFKATYLCFNCV